ncbi:MULTISPECIES: H-NS family nucleoid-associated regulatory protein [unclassified Paraburkholderia]|uniref:H-NS family nucleoid-associated regulatory protein n=1 Tax=unclassified Paraburkholderia TaxID=2615204 RepID=UPI00288BC8C1|nr:MULTISPECIES: H-NS family nucleoid-associated regulatory protein [unclassified Paraburkholderia]
MKEGAYHHMQFPEFMRTRYGRYSTPAVAIASSAWHSASNTTGEIKVATLESLQAKIKKLEQQAQALVAKKASGVIEKIRDLMEKHGLTTADIDAHAGGKQRAKHAAAKTAAKPATSDAKYRDPKSGATWSGHGRAPQWIAAAKNRDKYMVDVGTAAVKPLPAKEVKSAGAYVRGPQLAKYQDPKSGATWSGRGRAPAWLANVKDRSKFLIAAEAEATVATAAGAVSKAKAAVKKASKAVGATAGKGQRKGLQPAKYRDPKAGATWSGRGPAPAWLAGAKDRSKFLIDGNSTAADAKPAVTKAVAKKAPAAKKTAAKKTVGAKVPANKTLARNAPRKSVGVPAPVATVESDAELTT